MYAELYAPCMLTLRNSINIDNQSFLLHVVTLLYM